MRARALAAYRSALRAARTFPEHRAELEAEARAGFEAHRALAEPSAAEAEVRGAVPALGREAFAIHGIGTPGIRLTRRASLPPQISALEARIAVAVHYRIPHERPVHDAAFALPESRHRPAPVQEFGPPPPR